MSCLKWFLISSINSLNTILLLEQYLLNSFSFLISRNSYRAILIKLPLNCVEFSVVVKCKKTVQYLFLVCHRF